MGAEDGYDYGVINGRCAFQCSLVVAMFFYLILFVYFTKYLFQLIVPKEELLTETWYLLLLISIGSVVFALFQSKIIDMLGYTLQESVYILELPMHLKNRNIYSYYPHKINNNNNKNNYPDNLEAGKPSFFRLIFQFLFKITKIKFFDNTRQSDYRLSPVTQGGYREDVQYKKIQVGQGDAKQNSDNVVFNAKCTDKNNKTQQEVEQCAADGNEESLEDAGYGELWLCRSCAFPAVGKNTEIDGGFFNFKGKNGSFVSKPYSFKRHPQHEKCDCVPEFVHNDGWIVANKETAEKCKYIYHLINQAPFKGLTKKAKAYIVLTSPVWLFHLLLDGKNIKIISPEKYKEWKLEHSDVFSLMDTNGPDMAATDGIVSGICMGLLSSAVVMAVLPVVVQIVLFFNGPQ